MNDETPKPRWGTRLLHRPGWLIALAVCLLLSAVLVPFGWRYYRTQQLVAGIEAHGGFVLFEGDSPVEFLLDLNDSWQSCFKQSVQVHVGEGTFDDRYFREFLIPLNELHELTVLSVGTSEISKSRIAEWNQFQKLYLLSISGDNVDDEFLRQIGLLPNLRFLALDNSQVTDEGLRHLSGLKNLTELSLSNTDVTDEGVSELQRHLPGLDVSDD